MCQSCMIRSRGSIVEIINCPDITHIQNFPQTKYLIIIGCPKLTMIPNMLNLKELYITDCGPLVIPNIPSLVSIKLERCDLENIIIKGNNKCELSINNCNRLTSIVIKKLKSLHLHSCVNVSTVSGNIKNICIVDCNALINIDHKNSNDLIIKYCKLLDDTYKCKPKTRFISNLRSKIKFTQKSR
jgi:hypothetical protein